MQVKSCCVHQFDSKDRRGMRVMRKQWVGPSQTQTCGSIKAKDWTEALWSVDYKWRMGKEAGSASIKLPDTSPAIISEHSINRNTEVDLASRVPLTALITGALAQALRMFCMRQRALLPRVALNFLWNVWQESQEQRVKIWTLMVLICMVSQLRIYQHTIMQLKNCCKDSKKIYV